MIKSAVNVSVIAWWEGDDLSQHHDRKPYAYNADYPLICELNYFLPFQLSIPNSTNVNTDVSSFVLIDNAGTSIDVTTEMKGTGLEYYTAPSTHDIVIYPSTIPLATDLKMGRYHALMTLTDGRSYYSEKFRMCDYVGDFIKVEYWHNSTFEYPGGSIIYNGVYKNYFYINSQIGKPRYENESRADRRDAKNYYLQQISYKVFRFELIAAEYFVDALRLVWHHDAVKVYYNSVTYECDEFLMLQPEWQEQGDLAPVTCEFHTDTVVVTNAKAYTATEYAPPAGTCMFTDYSAEKVLSDDTADYTNGTGLETGEYVIVLQNSTGNYILQRFDSGSYDTITQSDFEVVYNKELDKYWFKHGSTLHNKPFITEVLQSPLRVKGHTFPGTMIQVYSMVFDRPPNKKSGYGTAALFETTGIEFDEFAGDDRNRVYVEAVTFKCSSVAEQSDSFPFDPAPTWVDPDATDWLWL